MPNGSITIYKLIILYTFNKKVNIFFYHICHIIYFF